MNIKKTLVQLYEANVKAINAIIHNKQIHNKREQINYEQLFEEVHENASPCFVLSTGRCGTHLLTKLLSRHKNFKIYHEPVPELIYYSKYAYDNLESKYEEIGKIVDAGRYEYIRDCYLLNLQFVETNNRITFFANQLAELYPKAKFIHLVRNPISFVKSGLGRDWYTGKNFHDEGRIKLLSDKWNGFTDVQKIAWLWEATNKFIDEFKTKVDKDRIITIRSEDLFAQPEPAVSILKFLEYPSINEMMIKKVIKKPTNTGGKKTRTVLSDELLAEIQAIAVSAEKYNYL